jgi:hypothetical protein
MSEGDEVILGHSTSSKLGESDQVGPGLDSSVVR